MSTESSEKDPMFIRQIWPLVTLISIVLVCVTVLLIVGIDPTAVISVMSVLVVPVLTAMLYGKVQQIEQNTNGAASRRDEMIRDVLEHFKNQGAAQSDIQRSLSDRMSEKTEP